MELKGLNYWSNSIAQLVKKTEQNLLSLNSRPSTAPIKLTQQTIVGRSSNVSRGNRSQSHEGNVIKEFEQIVIQNNNVIKQEYKQVLERINQVEQSVLQQDSERQAHKTYIKEIEGKIMSEIQALNEMYYTVLKKEDLKIAQESIKKANIAEINYLDSKIQRIDKDLQNFNYKYEKLVDQKLENVLYDVDYKIECMKRNSISNNNLEDFKDQLISYQNGESKKLMDGIQAQIKSQQKVLKELSLGLDQLRNQADEEGNTARKRKEENKAFEKMLDLKTQEQQQEIDKLKQAISELTQHYNSKSQVEQQNLKRIEKAQSKNKRAIKKLQQSDIEKRLSEIEQNCSPVIMAQIQAEIGTRQELEQRLQNLEKLPKAYERQSDEASDSGDLEMDSIFANDKQSLQKSNEIKQSPKKQIESPRLSPHFQISKDALTYSMNNYVEQFLISAISQAYNEKSSILSPSQYIQSPIQQNSASPQQKFSISFDEDDSGSANFSDEDIILP